MILLELFFTFFKLGTFAFGGAYGAISLFLEEVTKKGWMTEEFFASVFAISEATPGPIMVNVATYVGAQMGGALGAILTTVAVILPSFIIIILVTKHFMHVFKNPKIQGALKGVKQCMVGIIIATGLYFGFNMIFGEISNINFDYISLIILAVALAFILVYKKIFKREISNIYIIILCGALGGILY
ncbi:MAG: chromate transporter [Bacillota bacterium]